MKTGHADILKKFRSIGHRQFELIQENEYNFLTLIIFAMKF